MRNLSAESGDEVFEYIRGYIKTLDCVIYCARRFECAARDEHERQTTAPITSLTTYENFNDKLKTDVFWISFDHDTYPRKAKSFPILHMVHSASPLSAAWVLETESATSVKKAIDGG